MSFRIRPSTEADFPGIVAILNAQLPEPTTLADYNRQEQLRQPTDKFARYVAETADHEVVALGLAMHGETDLPGHFNLRVRVDAEHRRAGIGRVLYAKVAEFALAEGATRLETVVREQEPESLAWAERRGYSKDHHLFESTIALNEFDPARFGDAVERVVAGGIRLTDLATAFPGEDRLRRFYEIALTVGRDVPGFGERPFPSFELWSRWVTENPRYNPQSVFLAMDGDRCVGLSDMTLTPRGGMYNSLTGVVREYRGRGIAMALKVVALEWAKARQVPYVRTNNDSLNQPMLAVNRKLGYIPEPGMFFLCKDVNQA